MELCESGDFDLCVMGAPRPKGAEGYRSRMDLKPLTKSLPVPLFIIPHPDR
jgi:hypothetical protein